MTANDDDPPLKVSTYRDGAETIRRVVYESGLIRTWELGATARARALADEPARPRFRAALLDAHDHLTTVWNAGVAGPEVAACIRRVRAVLAEEPPDTHFGYTLDETP